MTNAQRLHVHINVSDLSESKAYYSALFGTEPTREKGGYVQWRLDNPSVNFAISSTCGETVGISHLGIQVDEDSELDDLDKRLKGAEQKTVEETDAICCYARSDKVWSTDPSGIAWELFQTHEDVEEMGSSDMELVTDKQRQATGGCC